MTPLINLISDLKFGDVCCFNWPQDKLKGNYPDGKDKIVLCVGENEFFFINSDHYNSQTAIYLNKDYYPKCLTSNSYLEFGTIINSNTPTEPLKNLKQDRMRTLTHADAKSLFETLDENNPPKQISKVKVKELKQKLEAYIKTFEA